MRLTASRPEIQSRAALLLFSASFFSSPFKSSSSAIFGLLAVAVVGFVVEHEDVFHAHQVGHDALDHLAFGFQCIEVVAAALKQCPPAGRELDSLAKLESVVVGDDDLGPLDVVEHVAGNQLAAGVVAVGVVRLENAQAVLDRQAWGDDQEAACKAVCWSAGGRR